MTRFSISTAILMMAFGMMTHAQAANPCNQDFRAMTQVDLDTLQHCGVFKGTLTIEGSGAEELELRGISEIDGSLVLQGNAALRKFQAPQLTKTTQLRLINQTVLGKLHLPVLTQANTLMLSVLPALEHLDFPAGLTTTDKVHIEDTRAPTVTGFKPDRLTNFELISNNYLKQFDFSSVKQVDGALHVASNGLALNFLANQLTSIQTGEFRNVARITMPQLNKVHGDLIFQDNKWTELNLDALEWVGGTLTMTNNDDVIMTSFAHLSKIGGALAIGNNRQLLVIDTAFPNLNQVDGTVDLAGHFNTLHFPQLQDVRGGMRLQTTSKTLECSELERHLKGGELRIVKGEVFSCNANLDEAQFMPTLGQQQEENGKANGGGFPITKGLVSDLNGIKSPASEAAAANDSKRPHMDGAVSGAASGSSFTSSTASLFTGLVVAALFGF